MTRVGLALLVFFSSEMVFCEEPSSCHNFSNEQRVFIGVLLSHAKLERSRVLTERRRITLLHTRWQDGLGMKGQQEAWLNLVTKEYELPLSHYKSRAAWERLFKRVDVVPMSLLLAQAIMESGWGESRFAKEGYNYFGQWCYTSGCGMVPDMRINGASHEVKKFSSIDESVQSYIHNINTFRAYERLRSLRADQHKQSPCLVSDQLASGLLSYSENGSRYVRDINSIIHDFCLSQFDECTL